MASVTLNKDNVKFVWNARLLDATVIEISPELAARFKSYGAHFLQVGEATPNVDVVILQFPSGNFSIADGDIEAVNGDKVFYQIGTEGGSSGSPLLDLDCVALAMHNAGSGAASSQPSGHSQSHCIERSNKGISRRTTWRSTRKWQSLDDEKANASIRRIFSPVSVRSNCE